jgi:hypothetical protein
MDKVRDAKAARPGEPFQPCGEIDTVAVNVIALDDDIAEVDPDAKLDGLPGIAPGVAFGHRALDFNRAAHRVDDAGELDQGAVAHQLDDAPVVLGNRGIDQFGPVTLKPRQRAGLILAHEARVADHIGGQNCREPPLLGRHGHR